MKTICETPRLTLRTLTLDDAPFYLALLNEPSFLENIGDRGVHTLEQAVEAIRNGPLKMQEERGHSMYMVELREDGTRIGMCGLIKRDTLDGVDIGYAYRPAYWGKGYALEAAAAVRDHARRDVGLDRLLGITSPGNAGSIAVLTRLGFQFERFTYLTPEDKGGTNIYSLDLRAPA